MYMTTFFDPYSLPNCFQIIFGWLILIPIIIEVDAQNLCSFGEMITTFHKTVVNNVNIYFSLITCKRDTNMQGFFSPRMPYNWLE